MKNRLAALLLAAVALAGPACRRGGDAPGGVGTFPDAPVVLVGRDGEPARARFHVRPEEMGRIVAELSGNDTTKGK